MLATAAVVVVVVLVGIAFGWEWAIGAIVASGAGLGAWIGIQSGNKKARETDKYRDEWLGKPNRSRFGEAD